MLARNKNCTNAKINSHICICICYLRLSILLFATEWKWGESPEMYNIFFNSLIFGWLLSVMQMKGTFISIYFILPQTANAPVQGKNLVELLSLSLRFGNSISWASASSMCCFFPRRYSIHVFFLSLFSLCKSKAIKIELTTEFRTNLRLTVFVHGSHWIWFIR